MRCQTTARGGGGVALAGWVAALAVLSLGCGGGPKGADAGLADASQGQGGDAGAGTCTVAFSYRPSASVTSVYLVAEWDDFNRSSHPLANDGSDTWMASLAVPAGVWGYYFIASGAQALDPANPDTVQRAGQTCSLLFACQQPGSFAQTVAIAGASASAPLTVAATLRGPDNLAFPDSTWEPLGASQVSVSGTKVSISLTGLGNGKYTVRLLPSQAGASLAEVRLPFWIEESRFDWRDGPLYMLMTDRFRNGDPTNDPPATAGVLAPADFKGGDLQGVEASLHEGYFDQLGVRSIWLTPWYTQPPDSWPDTYNPPHQIMGYHGYWPIKAREVDPRFGGGAALASMVKEAHKHGIRIVMDTVLNDVHREHEYFQDPAKQGWFRTGCSCGDGTPGCGWDDYPGRLSCLFASYLPDVNWSLPEVQAQYSSDVLWWLDTFDVDGLRVDAVKHIEPEGIQAVATAVRDRYEQAGTKYFMFGESFTGDVGLINSYVNGQMLDAQLDFPLYFAVPAPVFSDDSQGLQTVKGQMDQAIANFHQQPMVRFIGSQDEPRFVTESDYANNSKENNKWDTDSGGLPGQPTDQRAYDRLFSALVNLMTTPGVPMLYFGDEYGEFGGSDPDNRHMLVPEASLNAQQASQLARTRKLLSVRGSLRGLGRGTLEDMWCNSDAWGSNGGDLMAYARVDSDPKQSAVIVLNLKYESWPGVVVNFPPDLGWTSGTVTDALTDHEWSLSASSATVDVDGRTAVILRLK